MKSQKNILISFHYQNWMLICCFISFILNGTFSCKWFGKLSKQDALNILEEEMLNQDNPLILLDTSMGEMIIELYKDSAPKTVDNFLGLAQGKKKFLDPKTGKWVKRFYYDGLIFHRVIPNFMIQGGDILGNGTGGPGYKFEDEISAVALGLDKLKIKDFNYYQNDMQNLITKELQLRTINDFQKKRGQIERKAKTLSEISVEELLSRIGYSFKNELRSIPVDKYTLAMANSGPNTNGSQFFINLVHNKHLYGKHTVFGKVLKGRSVADKIGNVPRNNNDKPLEDVLIKKVSVLQ